jgi:glutathione synthase/RimK-type ligase-like ATP-grasp enzyme
LPARDGSLYVLEVNGIPGWEGLQQATGIDVAAAIVEHLERVQRASSEQSQESLPV